MSTEVHRSCRNRENAMRRIAEMHLPTNDITKGMWCPECECPAPCNTYEVAVGSQRRDMGAAIVTKKWTSPTSGDVVEQAANLLANIVVRVPRRGAIPRARAVAQALADAGLLRVVSTQDSPTICTACRGGEDPCPTCSGPVRETVDMVCQTCGTDYGPLNPTANQDQWGRLLRESE